MRISLSVDVEPDCPPYLRSFRGITDGLPRLLSLFGEEGVPATFFTTGDVARRFPDMVRRIVAAGHELGCHGDTHRNFATLNAEEARREIQAATLTLRHFAPVTSFRAPYLSFPEPYVEILREQGYRVDSSSARYKWPFRRPTLAGRVVRIPASTTSSILRLRPLFRNMVLRRLADPVVLFVHPWELCDFRHDRRLRIDCRFNTGATAVECLRETIRFFKVRGGDFRRITRLVTES